MKATKEEYDDHIRNYKGKLEIIITEIVQPPMKSHIDKVTGDTIATVVMEWMDDDGNIAEDDSLFEYYIKQ